MISSELARELKEAGYPVKTHRVLDEEFISIHLITLSGLIEACGEEFAALRYDRAAKTKDGSQWVCDRTAHGVFHAYLGKTPSIAVARLWLALNKKENGLETTPKTGDSSTE